MEFIKSTSKWGNSAGILLPKEWIGKEVKVILIDRTQQIKKEVLDILYDCMDDIMGIYLVGSYARNEQTESSDIDLIAISGDIKKEILSGKYHISIVPLKNIKNTINESPILILPRLYEAKAILNKFLLKELLSAKIEKKSFNEFIAETKRIIKINKGLIELDKDKESIYASEIVYSLILRLRGIFLAKYLIEGKKYTNKLFLSWLNDGLKENIQEIYALYLAEKNGKKIKKEIKTKILKKLLNLLIEEVKKW